MPALAEKADRDQPLQIDADRVDVDERKRTSIFSGGVVMTQGTLVLKADRVTVREDDKGNQFGTAIGAPVTFRQKRDRVDEYIEGEGRRMEYDSSRQIIELHERAELRRDGDVVRGEFIEYNSNTGQYRVLGAPQAAGKANGKTEAGGRVRAVIQPRSRSEGPAGQ